ncbi:cell wall hydrolase [Brevundimonas bacteroides]|uniref:cell wall hydrolase n=1 Tax=Brevundimonas bacteroides TaxID=74311 RepID=UPI0004978568|nr:cell wall hydrolase [Brevundimonas bacteroides]
MSAQDASLERPALHPVLERISTWLSALALSPLTPSALGIVASLAILLAAGGALLHTRLGELAAARTVGGDEPAAPTAMLTPTLDYTLAPDALREVSMDEARAFNAALPFSTLPIQAARPFIMPPQQIADYARALDCLTAAVYYEAASETAAGQAAVAQVVINRMRHPAFPKTICGVVFQGQERTTGCQFSFTCDGAMARAPSAAGWGRARAVAAAALNGAVAPQVGMATHYHTDWVAPYWAERLVKMTQIGTHIFYRWTGAWGLAGAFTGRHAGAEPVIAKLAAIGTYVEELPAPLPEDVTTMVDVVPTVVIASLEVAADAPLAIEDEGWEAPADSGQLAITSDSSATLPLANPLVPPASAPTQRRSRLAVPR